MSVLSPPIFDSLDQWIERRGDVAFWRPYLVEALARRGLSDTSIDPVAGHNPTFPTFVAGEVVVKFFGFAPAPWGKNFRCERDALLRVSNEPGLRVPGLLAHGSLFDDPDRSWPYIVTSRVRGIAMWRAGLAREQQFRLAHQLGEQIRLLHEMEPVGVATVADWPPVNLTEAAAQSSLPPHLVEQADDYVRDLPLAPPGSVIVNGDIVANHVYIEGERLTGIIDWGDTMIGDRHLELIQLYRDTFACDRDLFRTFLQACGWPVSADFPRRAMGFALYRQALGLAQHLTIDVFMPIAERYPLERFRTLDELAMTLFDLDAD